MNHELIVFFFLVFFLNNFAVSTSMILNAQSMYKGFERAFCVRMKSTLTKRGCHFKSSGYRVCNIVHRKFNLIFFLFLCKIVYAEMKEKSSIMLPVC